MAEVPFLYGLAFLTVVALFVFLTTRRRNSEQSDDD
ncbi:transmembrane domain-containing protein [uncultured Roseobacter sp.]|nr:transmembrane domain-containing protein [uncultured Roseobacter sp.]